MGFSLEQGYLMGDGTREWKRTCTWMGMEDGGPQDLEDDAEIGGMTDTAF